MLSSKTLLQVTGAIFCIVGLIHFVRLLTGFQVVIAGWTVPYWFSIIGILLAWYLAYNTFVLSQKKKIKK